MARRRIRVDDEDDCPCTSGAAFGECCGSVLLGRSAATAEALMRSRFTAFSIGDTAYLLRSWHPETRPATLALDLDQRWTRLDIVAADAGGALDATGVVAFVAHYDTPRGPGSLAERSRFSRVGGAWVYVDGDIGT